ncbi:hypothetical protein RN001_001675 [Aquatica leii]|uniref:DUF4806 domain-containing protein n=1 Tax=Aquatica leii TaxID=1421715 RepID=A0AAN7SLG0_9COLE|nr:hypothetical protein RN001_001675 [Aquatica leii]
MFNKNYALLCFLLLVYCIKQDAFADKEDKSDEVSFFTLSIIFFNSIKLYLVIRFFNVIKFIVSTQFSQMDFFKVVSTIEKNGVNVCVVPHKWEAAQVLKWPGHLNHSTRESLRCNVASAPEDCWVEYPCIVKCTGLTEFKDALRMEKELSKCIDTDAEEGLFIEMAQKKKRHTLGNISNLIDRNDLFDKHKKENKIKIISQEVIEPISSNDNAVGTSVYKTLFVNTDGSLQTISCTNSSTDTIPNQVGIGIEETLLEIREEMTTIINEIKNIKSRELRSAASVVIAKPLETDLLSLINFPLASSEEIEVMDKEIRNNERFKAQLISYLSKIGGTSREADGTKVAYKIVDRVFTPTVLINYTWTGISRDKMSKKMAFQGLEGILNVFFEVVSLADSRHTIQKNNNIFKDGVLKYALKRSLRKICTTNNSNDTNETDEIEATIEVEPTSMLSITEEGNTEQDINNVEKSQRSGSGVDDLYTSHLWYFNLLMFLTDHELPTTSIDNIEDLSQELDLEVDNNKDMLDGEENNSIPSQSNINNEVRKKEKATLVDASRINKRGGSDEKRGPSKIKKMKIEKSKYFLRHAQMRFNRNLQKAKP